MKELENNKFLLNNKRKGRQSIQLFKDQTVNNKEIDGIDSKDLVKVLINSLSAKYTTVLTNIYKSLVDDEKIINKQFDND